MAKRMLIDATQPEEVRVAVVDGNRLEELDFESASRLPLKGNIYLARVTRVEPSLQAAFVEYGGNRHGFLAFAEIHPDYYRIPQSDRRKLLEAVAEAEREVLGDDEDDFDGEIGAALVQEGEVQLHEGLEIEGVGTLSEVEDSDDADAFEVDESALADAGSADEGDAFDEDDEDTDEDEEIVANPGDTLYAQAGDDDADAWDSDDESLIDAQMAEAGVALPADAEDEDPRLEASLESLDELASALPDLGPLADEDIVEIEIRTPEGTEIIPLQPEPRSREARRGGRRPQQRRMRRDDSAEDVQAAIEERRRRILRSFKIQEVIKRRQILLVQVVKEERGNKGAALTTYLSLAGRFCVLMPNTTGRAGGISRKITNPTDRKRLREIMGDLEVPDGMAVILRTAGVERSKAEIKRDLDYLLRLWSNIRDRTMSSVAPCLIYEEADLIKRSIRDLYGRDIDDVLVEGELGYRDAKDFMKLIMPAHAKRVQRYSDPTIPLFLRYQVEAQIDAMHSPTVGLKSGGYIVINPTEALVAIDVNSGRATKEKNIEETAFRTNLEAADEVARQLRLRDLAGLIVIDFIDMEDPRHNAAVERRLKEAMRTDRARLQIGRISNFGLLELSRQRLRPSLQEMNYHTCPHCQGTGVVRSTESAALMVLRALEEEGIRRRSTQVTVSVPVDLALYLLNQKRGKLNELETRYGFEIVVAADGAMRPGEMRIDRVKGRVAAPEQRQSVTAEQVYADVAAEAAELDAEPAEEAVEDEAETVDARSSDAGEDDRNGRSRRGGRRRRRRGERDGVSTGSVTVTAPLGSDDEDGEVEGDDSAEPAEAADAAGDAGAEDENGRRRRRGRRGGRRRREGQPGTEADGSESPYPLESDQPEAAGEAAEAASASEPAAEGEAAEGEETGSRRRRGDRRRTRSRTRRDRSAEGSEESEESSVEAVGEELVNDNAVAEPAESAAPAEPAPAAEPTPVAVNDSTEAAPAAASMEPADALATVEPRSTEDHGVLSLNQAPEKPRRGWWGRLVGGEG